MRLGADRCCPGRSVWIGLGDSTSSTVAERDDRMCFQADQPVARLLEKLAAIWSDR
jgi:hypothetical protein